MLKVSPKYKK